MSAANQFSKFRLAAMACSFTTAVLFASPSFADLVEFEWRGRVTAFNEDTPMPNVHIGTRASASFVVDTACTVNQLDWVFNDDGPDPSVQYMSYFGTPPFKSVSARIGPNHFQSDTAGGQIHFQQGFDPDTKYLLSMNVVVNLDDPNFWVVWVPGAPHEGELRASEVLAPDGLASALAHFDEEPVFETTITVGGFNDITIRVDKWTVRRLTSTAPTPCGS